MKRIFKRCLLPLLAALISVSCIYDAPGDRFYRTLWESDEVPLGPLPVDELTLEFLCGQAVSIKIGQSQAIVYGIYDSNNLTAIFQNLTLHIDGVSVVFVDAERSGDILYLRWRVNDSLYPFTTPLHRLSAYPS